MTGAPSTRSDGFSRTPAGVMPPALEVPEIAEPLGVSPATVKRDWQFARAWLQREMR